MDIQQTVNYGNNPNKQSSYLRKTQQLSTAVKQHCNLNMLNIQSRKYKSSLFFSAQAR